MDDAMITVGILAMLIVITLFMLVINFNKINRLNEKLNYTEKELINLKDEMNQLRMAVRPWNYHNIV